MKIKALLWFLSLPLILSGCGGNISTVNGPTAYQIQMAIYTPLCLEVQGATTAEGGIVQTYPCQSPTETRQQWTFTQVDAAGYNIVNVNSQQCLSVSYDSTQLSTPIVQAPCYHPALRGQTWTFTLSTDPKIYGVSLSPELSTPANPLCLDIPQGQTVGSTQMQIYTCTPSNPAQAFLFNRLPLATVP